MDLYLIVGGILVFILIAAVIIPKRLDTQNQSLTVTTKALIDDYFSAHVESDLERRKLMFHKLAVSVDRVLSHIMSYYGCKERSVKQQIRSALKKKIITYDQFQSIKKFHHMRNEVVHEGLEIAGDNEYVVYGALEVMKSVLHG